MKRNILIFGLIFSMAVLIMSCFPEDELTFKGTFVEFKNHTTTYSAATLTARGVFTAGNDSARTVLEATRVRDTVLVQLVGKQRSTPTVLDFTIRAASSTAVYATHYTVNAANSYDPVTSTGTVTIPAGKSSGIIVLDLIDAQAAAATRTVDLRLLGNDNTAPSANYFRFKVTIRGQ